MNPAELAEVLKLHSEWLANPFKGKQADLSNANLFRADLRHAYLSSANLLGANLYGADLSYADLYSTVLNGADLSYANLSGANLRNANLPYVNLSGANLTDANLPCTNLCKANLTGANLSYADLRYADLTDTDLRHAKLSGAHLLCANLTDVRLPNFQLCPQDGPFEAYKKVCGDVVLKLRIEGPRTSSLVGRKCRTSKAFVMEAYGSEAKEFKSLYSPHFTYKIGEYVEVWNYDPDIGIECTSGIHFFMTREEAENYRA